MRDIDKWDPEDDSFWRQNGEKIANRNLWISISSLFCGFSVWMYWGVITVQMLNLGFYFSYEQLFSLIAIAGFSGATLRIPSSFFIQLCGGRYTIFFTTALLIIPAIGTGVALQDKNTSLWVFQLMALLSGIGGGNFTSSMSNISFFFPKKRQGLALGLNAGLSNFGVTAIQLIVPLVMSSAVFAGEPLQLINASGTVLGKLPEGSDTYIQNASYIWVLFLVPITFLCWFGMTDINSKDVSPYLASPLKAFSLISLMLLISFFWAAWGLWLILPAHANGADIDIPKEIVLTFVILATLFCLKSLPGTVNRSLSKQYTIFNNKHTWVMGIIYTMTFGSFIGFAAAFPFAIKVIFGYQHIMVDGVMTHTTVNTNGPSALMYAWMGAFIGALIRPLGGWLGDQFGGAFVTQACCIVMVLSTLGASHYMQLAFHSANPEEYFLEFFSLFLILFSATGIANGSTFKTIAVVFPKEQAGHVLSWTSAIAAYGAFYIPSVLGEQISATTPEAALISFTIFYTVCLFINWWFYLRKEGEFYNP